MRYSADGLSSMCTVPRKDGIKAGARPSFLEYGGYHGLLYRQDLLRKKSIFLMHANGQVDLLAKDGCFGKLIFKYTQTAICGDTTKMQEQEPAEAVKDTRWVSG